MYEDFDDDGDSCDDVEEDIYEVECPNCGETICVDEDIVLDGFHRLPKLRGKARV